MWPGVWPPSTVSGENWGVLSKLSLSLSCRGNLVRLDSNLQTDKISKMNCSFTTSYVKKIAHFPHNCVQGLYFTQREESEAEVNWLPQKTDSNTTEVQTEMHLSPALTLLLPLPPPHFLLAYTASQGQQITTLCAGNPFLFMDIKKGQKIWLSGQTQPAPSGRFWDLGFLVGLMGLNTKLGQFQFPKVGWKV